MSIENKKCDCCFSEVKDHLTLVGGLEICDECLKTLVKTTRNDILDINDLKDFEKHRIFNFVCNMVTKDLGLEGKKKC